MNNHNTLIISNINNRIIAHCHELIYSRARYMLLKGMKSTHQGHEEYYSWARYALIKGMKRINHELEICSSKARALYFIGMNFTIHVHEIFISKVLFKKYIQKIIINLK